MTHRTFRSVIIVSLICGMSHVVGAAVACGTYDCNQYPASDAVCLRARVSCTNDVWSCCPLEASVTERWVCEEVGCVAEGGEYSPGCIAQVNSTWTYTVYVKHCGTVVDDCTIDEEIPFTYTNCFMRENKVECRAPVIPAGK